MATGPSFALSDDSGPTAVRRPLEHLLVPGGAFPPLLAYNHEEEEPMSNENVELFRSAYDTYSRGDVSAILRFVSRRDHQEARAFAGLD
jgi:hypothetical protein